MARIRLLAVAVLLTAACCQPAWGLNLLRSRLVKRSAHFCGSELTTVLQMICGSAGISGASGKRTAAVGMADFHDRRLNSVDDRSPQLDSYDRQRMLEALDPLSSSRRESREAPGGPDRVRVKRQGIVEECCYNPCSTSTLRSYCNF